MWVLPIRASSGPMGLVLFWWQWVGCASSGRASGEGGFSTIGGPCHILITTPAPQHTQFDMMETVMQGKCHSWSSWVLFQLLLRQTFLRFSSTECCSSEVKMTILLSMLLCSNCTASKGDQSLLGSEADQVLSHQPLFAQLPCLEKSLQISCPVQFASLILG